MAKTSPFEFIQQVRRETAKVTWPTRNETAVTTLMVFIMVALASVFFAVVDMVLQFGVKYLLGAGG
ncbi:MAG: preprotein translocase subunit SecE [Pseudomonadota bacterium]|jgi:preprotein translocase subunit SecE